MQNLIKGKCKRKTQTDRKIVLSSNALKTRNSNPSIFQEPLEKNQNVFIMNQTNKQRMKSFVADQLISDFRGMGYDIISMSITEPYACADNRRQLEKISFIIFNEIKKKRN